jgi:hypothetical protein
MKQFKKTQNYALTFDQTLLSPQERKFTVDASAQRIKGIAILPRGATITTALIKVQDTPNQMILDYAPLGLYQVSTAYPVAERFIPVDLKAEKQNLVITVEPFTAGTGLGTIDIILALE